MARKLLGKYEKDMAVKKIITEVIVPKIDHETVRITQKIERYLFIHPKAADAIEGLTKWWLQRQCYIDSKECINNALDILIQRGLVKKIINVDGENIYRCSLSCNGAC